MTLAPSDKARILAHIQAIRVYLRVQNHDPLVVIKELRKCLEEERLYDKNICLVCKKPWVLHPQDANGMYHCFDARFPFPEAEGYRQVSP